MEFRTVVDIEKLPFELEPCDELLFIGSCFADNIGARFREEKFRVVTNPYGVMYNPVSILHTVEHMLTDEKYVGFSPKVAFFTLGTNHVYREIATGEIVDNCRKRPQALFHEEKLTVDECCDTLTKASELLRERNPGICVVLTVSPVRYRKYGFHESRISKATLLLAVSRLQLPYFPAYEIIDDELRDYRFYKPDMIHPSEQAVEYLWERLVECCFSERAREFLKEWKPLKEALAHKPFNPESGEYRAFMDKTMLKVMELSKKYPNFAAFNKKI